MTRILIAGGAKLICTGLYRLQTKSPLNNPDFAQVAIKVPKAVICLISALSFHGLTTQIPHEVSIALKKNDYYPRFDYPPVGVFSFSDKAFAAGTEDQTTDGIDFQIYSPEKTLADCFKYRNKIGLDVAIEALKLYKDRKKVRVGDLIRFSRIDRVENIIRPFLKLCCKEMSIQRSYLQNLESVLKVLPRPPLCVHKGASADESHPV